MNFEVNLEMAMDLGMGFFNQDILAVLLRSNSYQICMEIG
jgi:hypothetical protein